MNKKILVTGIGGNVAQGIARTIRHLYKDILIIGTNVDFLSSGNFLFDKVYEVPFSDNENYIHIINNICKNENIDLIIPATDYESYYLSLNRDSLPIVACSDSSTTEIFLKKSMTFSVFKSLDIPFAYTCLPKEYKNQLENIIIKPNEGRGSKNIFLNPKNICDFDDSYILQELIIGKEITTAFYVTIENVLLGHITMIRHLQNGTTMSCEVTKEFDSQIEDILQKIVSNISIKGSCNIQSIVNSDGEIIPFEVNCRISGTNSIRANFGFEDVKYTLQEYLFSEQPNSPKILLGSSTRILLDVIYPEIPLDKIENNKNNFYLY